MKKILLLLPVLLLCWTAIHAQTRQVTGKVIDDKGEALIGVSVLVKGTTTGASTDVNGMYKVNVTGSNAILVVKYLGYKQQEVAVGSQSRVDVTMQSDESKLDEVVIVGYGTQKRGDLTGAISSVKGEDIASNPVSSVAEALTGRLPGVQVTTVDGAPGAEIVIRVRGGGSITQDNSPLYIVDGFPVDNINNIATTDIASIDVLKDASSTAIYGARGANGVVIVTTKAPKAGRTMINYNGYGQARTFPRELDVLSPYEFVLAQYEYARLRSQTDVDNFSKYFGVYDDLVLYKNQAGTNWQQELFGNTTLSQQHNLSLSGGTDKTKLAFSTTYNKDQGLQIGSSYERLYMNFKLNHQISDKLKLDLASRFSNAVTNGAGTSGGSSVRVSDGITTRPVNGIADQIVIDEVSAADDDYESFIKSLVDPKTLTAQDYRKRTDKALNLAAALNWSIIKPLQFRSEFGYDLGFGNNKRYYGPLTGESKNNGGNLPLGEISIGQTQKFRLANTLNYNFTLNQKHEFTALLGQELVSGRSNSNFTRSKYFDVNLQPEKMFANFALGTQDGATTTIAPNDNLASFFGRLNYQFDKRFLFAATVRADASSKFAPGNRWGFFPAASAAWRLSQEEFVKNIDAISDLKLRVSYGASGNNRIQDDLWHRTYAVSVTRTPGFGDVNNPYWTAASSLLVNPDLKWETTITRNAGLDFGLFNNKLSGTFDAYWNTTKDLLVQSTIPSYTGYSSQMRNIGQTSNKGLELALNGNILNKKDFSLSASFNIGINRANIDKLDGVNEQSFSSNWASTDLKSTDDYRLIVGKTVGLMYGFVSDGFYKEDDFTGYNATTRTYTLKPGVPNVGALMGGISVRPGVAKLKDLDGDGNITAADRQIIGSALPKANGGFGFNMTYKGFDFSSFFNWTYGQDVYNTGKISLNMYYRTTFGNMLNTVNSSSRYKYIDGAGNLVTDLAALKALNANATVASPFSYGNASPVFQSDDVEDGSFLRASNLTLGYTIPKTLSKRIGISTLRLYGTVYNAFLITNYSGYDPEVSATRNSGYSALTPGVDYSGYPKSRTYSFGANITF